MRLLFDSAVRRAGWVLSDQALSSITNFGLAVVVLRALPTRQFGVYTISIAIYFVALGLCRALCGEPQVVRYSHAGRTEWRYATKASTGVALVLGTVAAVPIVASSGLLGGTMGAGLLALAVALPGLLVQDAWRYAFLSAGRPRTAFENDLAWALFQVGLVGAVFYLRQPSVGAFILAWGVSASLAGLLGCVQAGLIPRPRSCVGWLRLHRDLWPRYASEFLLGSGSAQCVFVGVGLISGLAAAGTLNAARVILGPFNIVALSAVGFAVPEGVALWRKAPSVLTRAMGALGACLGLLALTCGVAVLLLPERIGTAIVGASWPVVRDVMPWMTIFVAAAGVSEAARVGLRVLASAERSLAARAAATPLVVLGALAGAAIDGASGAAVGLAVSHSIGTWIWWRHFFAANYEALDSIQP